MRILIVSQYFRPEAFRINEVVDSLILSGAKVTVVTGQPNYPEGRCYKGYSPWRLGRKKEAGVDVVRVPLVMRGSQNGFLLALNYISFVFSAVIGGMFKLRGERYDVVFCYAPSPMLQAVPAIFFSWFFKAPFVFHVQDLWPQSLSETGYIKNKSILNLVGQLVGYIYRKCDRILISSKPFQADIARYNPAAEIHYLPNSVDGTFLVDTSSRKPSSSSLELFNCVFAGNVGSAQAVDTILDAAEILKAYEDISFDVYGSGSRLAHMELEKEKRGLTNLALMGRVPSSDMPQILASASALLVTLKDTEIFRATVPNKIQAYLAVGRPIIACMAGEGARIVVEANAGFQAEAENSAELAKTILKIRAMDESQRAELGRNGQRYFRDNFEHEKLVGQLLEHFEGVIART